MKKIRFRVTGMTALLMNSPKAMAAPKEFGATRKIPTPVDEAESGTYRNEKGNLCFPAMGFRSALVSAGVGFKFGKRGMPSVVKGTTFTLQENVDLVDPKTKKPLKDYVVDTRRCCLGSGMRKVAIMRSRPRLDSWGCEIEFEYDERFIDDKAITTTFERAGAIVGVGNFSPRLSGPYGRFTVEVI